MKKKISLRGGRSCLPSYYLAKPRVPRWLVFLPESAADFGEATKRELQKNLGIDLAKNFNLLIMNKPGVGPSGTQPVPFEMSFRRPRRLQDALTVMKTIIPPADEIFIVGYSEGAYLAPQVALLEERVKAVVMIGGGTRGWLKEELSNAGPLERRELLKQIKDIYRSPHSLKKWNAFSFATWYSYREDSTLKALRRLKVPVLAILGARDRTIDFKTSYSDLKKLRLKQKIKICVFKNCGHSFVSHWADAWFAVRQFLSIEMD